jgi:ABC-type sugar transport system substrate-binding protein
VALATTTAACSSDSNNGGDGTKQSGGASSGGTAWSTSLEPWGNFQLADYIQENSASAKRPKFVLVNPFQQGYWWTVFQKGITDAGEALGVDTQFVATQEYDVRQQVANIKTVIQGRPDGIGIFVGDEKSMGPVIDDAIDSGIPVVTYNVDAPKSKRLAYVGVDNFAYGRSVGIEFFKKFTKGEVILMSAIADSDYTRQRVAGLKSVAPDGVTFTDTTVSIGNDLSKAVGLVDAAVKANPQATAMYSADDSVAAIGLWVKKNNALGKYVVAGHNILPNDLEQAAADTIQVIVGQHPHRQGYAVVSWLNSFVRGGEKTCYICDAGFLPVTSPEQAKTLLETKCGGPGCG